MENTANKTTRRNLLKNAAGAAAVVTGAAALTPAVIAEAPAKEQKQGWPKPKAGEKRLFSSAVSFGNLLFLAGVGAHFPGTIQEHTKHVLDELEKQLTESGSSMDKVLKVNVYLNDLKDYQAMNETYMGRFGGIPPVRTTVAPAGGVPGNSLVEIDCIAYI
jgi:enamine deaminase RidA (YjgF/YER057c/UK114 family)